MIVQFGPAGNSDSFYSEGHRHTLEVFAWLKERALDAYEYQCGHGARTREETARVLGDEAKAQGITVSLHAPYYISLASQDPKKRENSLQYILQSARIVDWMGGERIVVHPGGLGGLSRPEATALAMDTLRRSQKLLDDEGLSHVRICPETMGKIQQLGDLDEVLRMCTVDERFLPCVDFGHLNSRTLGGLNSREAFAALLDEMENRLGKERASRFHAHFSKIEYSSGGEKRHLTFADERYGPEPGPLLEWLALRDMGPVVICESCGTQAEDAAAMKKQYWLQKKGESGEKKKEYEKGSFRYE